MEEHPHIQLVRDSYAAFGRGDLDAVRALFDPDIVWRRRTTTRTSLSGWCSPRCRCPVPW